MYESIDLLEIFFQDKYRIEWIAMQIIQMSILFCISNDFKPILMY